MSQQDREAPAVTRGLEMLRIPIKDLPPAAAVFAGYLCHKVGMCIETLLSAYATYAQVVEGLNCDNDLYAATPLMRAEWDLAQREYELVKVGSLRVRRRDARAKATTLLETPERVAFSQRRFPDPEYLTKLGKESCWCLLGAKCQGEHEVLIGGVQNRCGICGALFEISETDPHWSSGRRPICPTQSLVAGQDQGGVQAQ